MDADPNFTFPTLKLRVSYLSAIESISQLYSCEDESKSCGVESIYW